MQVEWSSVPARSTTDYRASVPGLSCSCRFISPPWIDRATPVASYDAEASRTNCKAVNVCHAKPTVSRQDARNNYVACIIRRHADRKRREREKMILRRRHGEKIERLIRNCRSQNCQFEESIEWRKSINRLMVFLPLLLLLFLFMNGWWFGCCLFYHSA